jgi:hypothetical protein
MRDWVQVGLLTFIAAILLEGRMRVAIKIAVIETDLAWIRGTLTKWGMAPPESKQN